MNYKMEIMCLLQSDSERQAEESTLLYKLFILGLVIFVVYCIIKFFQSLHK